MSRRIWIAVFSCALLSFAGVSAFFVALWAEHRHVPALGWLLLVSDALVFWIGLGYLRFRVREAHHEAPTTASSAVQGPGNLENVSRTSAATAAHDLSASPTPLHG